MATIKYFIPEDNDSEQTPNIYLAPKNPTQGLPPTLGQIKASFPLPGEYYFRFKSPLLPGADTAKQAPSVWMDVMDDDQPVGVWRNEIVVKVSRLSMRDVKYRYTVKKPRQQVRQQQRGNVNGNVGSNVNVNVNAGHHHSNVRQPVVHQQQSEANLLGFDHPQPPPPRHVQNGHSHSAPVSAHSSSTDLLGQQAPPPSLLDFGNNEQHSNSNAAYGDDLLGMGGHAHQAHQQQQQANNPFPF